MTLPPSGGGIEPDLVSLSNERLTRLREILVAPERAQIAELRRQVEDFALRADSHSEVLPAAVRRSVQRNGDLALALTPVVESALNDSVRRDPTVLTDAIFPIIGPAIRKAIAEALAGLVQSLNQTLEHTLSVQSFKWRLEAKRTGKSFAEVVLSRTLVYRVEQVFLIHRKTGLLLQHVHRPMGMESNADLMSGMFTAIQDFARDTLGVDREETLETMQVGDLNVWLNSSPHVMLAAVIRGAAPQDFRRVLQNAIEQIHRDQTEMLESFDGDPGPFEVTRPRLEDCLRSQAAADRVVKKKGRSRYSKRILATLAFVAVGALCYLLILRDKQRSAELQFQQTAAARRDRFVETLRAQEGTVITEAVQHDGKLYVNGLRDPLAPDLSGLIAASGLDPSQLALNWQPYYALSPGIVLQRAVQRLKPPPGVELAIRGESLSARGPAPATWIASARRIAESLPGITDYDDSKLSDETQARSTALSHEIEKTEISFGVGMTLKAGEDAKITSLANHIVELRSLAGSTRQGGPTIQVIGHVTSPERVIYNFDLGKRRAELVANLLKSVITGLSHIETQNSAQGNAYGSPSDTDSKVSFRVILGPNSSGIPAP